MKNAEEKKVLSVIDRESGEVIMSVTLTPKEPGALIHIQNKDWIEDKSPAGQMEAHIRAYEDNLENTWQEFEKLDAARAAELRKEYGYIDE